MLAAFPADLTADAEAAAAVMPASRLRPVEPSPVVVQGSQVWIPGRLYNDEPPTQAPESLSPRQHLLLHCLYTRHHDGRVRQRHLAEIVASTEPWVIPFVVQSAGDYVLEILVDLRDALRDLATPDTRRALAYGQFIMANPAFFARAERRVVSHWNCHYRHAYTTFHGYPGSTLIALLRSAATTTAGHPWPTVTPAGPRLHGYC
ncbi:hypothetical protein ABZ330_07910 [Streptomyces sp. NPDC006172]|uniref:hypothetical protein n=1 Tax=Streptomyces sp. NPDC006172 TaxID=3154470 RepID=UPI0033CD5910